MLLIYLIYAESANYCGYGQHFVVEAPDEDTAKLLAEPAVEEYFYEQDSDQYLDEHAEEPDNYGNIMTCEVFDQAHESWKYYCDPTQSEFYIRVNL